MMKYAGKFFTEFVANPGRVGALSPSSTSLRRKMLDWVDWKQANVVIEYGPGIGTFTESILSCLRPGAKFFAIEINPAFRQILTQRFPKLRVYPNSVEHVRDICEMEGVEHADAIISGLPWALFSDEMQNRYLASTLNVLRQQGQFATFAYLTGLFMADGKRFKHKLQHRFSDVHQSRIAWLNLPPALVYRCRR